MAGGQPALVVMTLSLAVAFGTVGLFYLRRTDLWSREVLIALSNLMPILWTAAFNHHFYVHAWFMTRIFTWTIATGFALFAIAVAMRQSIAPGGAEFTPAG